MLTPADLEARAGLDGYSERQIAAVRKQRDETRTVTLSVSDVNDWLVDDAELAAKVRRLWLEAGLS